MGKTWQRKYSGSSGPMAISLWQQLSEKNQVKLVKSVLLPQKTKC